MHEANPDVVVCSLQLRSICAPPPLIFLAMKHVFCQREAVGLLFRMRAAECAWVGEWVASLGESQLPPWKWRGDINHVQCIAAAPPCGI